MTAETYQPMTVIDLSDDEDLRYIQRVLESESTPQDRLAARNLIVAIRTRLRKTEQKP